MITDGLLTLAERKGSTKQALWKFLHTKYPEADLRQFQIRLKKLRTHGDVLDKEVKGGRFKLNKDYRKKILKLLKKGKNLSAGASV
jgi:hypothetical protein